MRRCLVPRKRSCDFRRSGTCRKQRCSRITSCPEPSLARCRNLTSQRSVPTCIWSSRLNTCSTSTRLFCCRSSTDALPALRKPTLDVQIEGDPYRIRAHMPLTVTPVISAVTLWRETPGDALHLSVYCGKFELPADPLLMVEQKGKIERCRHTSTTKRLAGGTRVLQGGTAPEFGGRFL